MRIAGQQRPPAQTLQVRMSYDALHHPFGQAMSAILRQHEDVSEISEGCAVSDDSRKSNLTITFVNTERKRVLDGSLYGFDRNPGCPIRVGQKSVNCFNVNSCGIRGNFKLASQPLLIHQLFAGAWADCASSRSIWVIFSTRRLWRPPAN